MPSTMANPIATAPRILSRRATLLSVALITLAGVVVYANSLDGVFVFDDNDAIKDNPSIRTLWPLSVPLTTTTTSSVTGRPVVGLTLALNYACGGLSTTGYHIVNVAVHILAALGICALLRLILQSAAPAYATWLPLAVALLWVVHPLNTDALNHVIYRTEAMMGLCYILALYCGTRGAQSGQWLWYALAIVLCVVGMGCKENMVSVPLAMLLIDRAALAGSFAEALRKRWGVYLGMFAAVCIGLALSRWSGVRHDNVGFNVEGLPFGRYLLVQAAAVVHYLRLAVWPSGLVLDYYEWPNPLSVGAVWWQIAVLVALAVVIGYAWLRNALWTVPWLIGWFILAPTCLIPNGGERCGEHRMYIPLLAVIIIVLVLLQRSLNLARPARIALVAILTIVLGVATVQRNTIYATELSVWQDVVEKRPDNPRGHRGVAESNYRAAEASFKACRAEGRPPTECMAPVRGMFELAVSGYLRSLEIEPENPEAYLNLGLIYHDYLPDIDLAILNYNEALKREAGYVAAHSNLGNLLMQQGREDEAIEHYRAAIAIQPGFVQARFGLAQALAMREAYTEAEAIYLETLENPTLYEAEVRNKLATLYRKLGRLDEAVEQFRTVVRLRPTGDAHFQLALTLGARGDTADAVAEFESALSKPLANPSTVHFRYAQLLHSMGETAQAIEHLQIALTIKPDFPAAQRALTALRGQ